MAKTRLMLQDRLEELLGSRNVYFSAPSGLKMNYPCIKYDFVNTRTDSADNINYMIQDRYSLIGIDPNPDSDLKKKLLSLPYCSLDRSYKADNLQHYVCTLYW